MDEIITRYFHFLGFIALVSALTAEHLLIARTISYDTFKKLLILDRIYGITAMITLAAGLILWFGVGKPQTFYSGNFLFHIKVTLFVLVGLLSIIPTKFILQNNKIKQGMTIDIPKSIIMVIRLQLVILLIIPLLAVLMAKGVGLS